MPWVSAAEYARMEAALETALQRAVDAENRLVEERKRLDDLVASERQSKDWVMVQLASRLVTKNGGYGLDHEKEVKVETQPVHPKGFVREPDAMDLAKLEYYKKCYLESGKPEGEAERLAQSLWDAEMRGETPMYDYEAEM